MLPNSRNDVVFCGFQAAGMPGRAIQDAGRQRTSVQLDDEEIAIRTGVHTIGGYSAHAYQQNELDFVGGMAKPPQQVRLVHGDAGTKQELARLLLQRCAGLEVVIPLL